jgi:hypothetical protein
MLKIAPERPRWRRGCLTNRGGWRDPPGGQLDPSRASYFLCSQSSSVLPPSRLLSHSSSAIPRGRDASSSSRRRAPHSRDSLSNRTHFLSSSPASRHPLLVCFPPPPFSNLPSPSRSAPLPIHGLGGSLPAGGGRAAPAPVPLLAVPDAPLPPRPPVSPAGPSPAPLDFFVLSRRGPV